MSAFSEIPTYEWLDDNEFAFVIRDPQPNHRGRVLVVCKRIVPTWFDATHQERLAIIDLIDRVKWMLDAAEPRPRGYNVGFAAGEAAGQTVMHLHVHVIPRHDEPLVAEAPALPSQAAVVSRPLPPSALDRARSLLEAWLVESGDRVLKLPGGRRARVLGPALEGGVRIVGPDTGFVECTIAELDLAWVIATEEEIAQHGGSLDVASVERLRVLDDTSAPVARAAETSWAIALLRSAPGSERALSPSR